MEGILFIFGKWRETFSNNNKFYSDDICVAKITFILTSTPIVVNNDTTCRHKYIYQNIMEGKIFTPKKWQELMEGSRLYISNELGRYY